MCARGSSSYRLFFLLKFPSHSEWQWSSIKLEKILNCKANVLVLVVVVAVVFPNSFRQFVINGQNLSQMTAIMSYSRSLSTSWFTTLLCTVDTVASHIYCQSNRLHGEQGEERERERADKRLTTTIMSTHKNRSEICNMFLELCKRLTPICPSSFHFVDEKKNGGIKATAFYPIQTHSNTRLGSFTHSLVGLI